MKKLLLLLLCLAPACSFAQSNGGGSEGGGSIDGPNSIFLEDPDDIDDDRNQAGVTPTFVTPFSAEILEDHTIMIMSETIATFSVYVRRQSNGTIVYSGTTKNSVIHITTDIAFGHYTLEICCSGKTYVGNFQMSSSAE